MGKLRQRAGATCLASCPIAFLPVLWFSLQWKSTAEAVPARSWVSPLAQDRLIYLFG